MKTGRYASVEAVVEDAIAKLMRDDADASADVDEEIDDDTYEALQRSEEQIRRGEGFTIDEVREHFRKQGIHLRPPRTAGGR